MEKSYKVPFAYDAEGNMVDYISAIKGVHYKCECGKKVALRGGDKISPHLYHVEPTECNGESLIHKAYKNAFERVKSVKLPYVVNGSDSLEFDSEFPEYLDEDELISFLNEFYVVYPDKIPPAQYE